MHDGKIIKILSYPLIYALQSLQEESNKVNQYLCKEKYFKEICQNCFKLSSISSLSWNRYQWSFLLDRWASQKASVKVLHYFVNQVLFSGIILKPISISDGQAWYILGYKKCIRRFLL